MLIRLYDGISLITLYNDGSLLLPAVPGFRAFTGLPASSRQNIGLIIGLLRCKYMADTGQIYGQTIKYRDSEIAFGMISNSGCP